MTAHRALADQLIAEYEQVDAFDGDALVPDRSPAIIEIRTNDAETRTLPDPENPGLRLTLCMEKDGGDCVITASNPVNQAGNNTLTLDDEGETIDLVAVRIDGAMRWRVVGNDGVDLSTV